MTCNKKVINDITQRRHEEKERMNGTPSAFPAFYFFLFCCPYLAHALFLFCTLHLVPSQRYMFLPYQAPIFTDHATNIHNEDSSPPSAIPIYLPSINLPSTMHIDNHPRNHKCTQQPQPRIIPLEVVSPKTINNTPNGTMPYCNKSKIK